jgi:leader peptidase (prepilin peptidase)/N-methyltransferase
MIYIFFFGLIIGSFLNAFEWRFSQMIDDEGNRKILSRKKLREISIVYGRSECVSCKHILRPMDLMPVLSWISLRGKCRYCSSPVSIQYPLIELLTASLFVFSYIFWPVKINSTSSSIFFFSWLIILAGFIVLALFDFKKFLLPFLIVRPLLVFSLLALTVCLFFANDRSFYFLHLISGLILGGILYLLYIFSKGKWLGGGDVSLGALIGFQLSSPTFIPIVLLISSIGGLLFLVILNRIKKVAFKAKIPFGPFLMFGCLIAVLFGTKIINWYFGSLH